jgi:hypothetical protein
VTLNSHHLGRVDVGAARGNVALSTIALALAAAAALAASVTHAHATAREISASSYGFADSLLPNTGLEHLPTLSPPGSDGALKCSVNCTVVVERLEPDASGSLTNWVVVSERTIDENGSHSWSLLSGAPSNTPWLPNDLYRFEGSWSSTDLLADTRPTPEASTWVMTLIGFAGLGMAGYRSPRNPWRPIQFSKRVTSR